MTIFVVSPTYLQAAYDESKKYNFDFQGYGSFRAACNGIVKVNQADLLGVAFLGVHLPSSRTKEYKAMVEFFNLIELMNANKKFVIATDDPVTPWVSLFKKYKNIRFVKAPDFDFMSDIVINKQVFGSILLDTSKPYTLHPVAEKVIDYKTPKLEYVPLFPDAQIQCVSHADILDTLERTLDHDAVYKRFDAEGAYLKSFRLYYIAGMLGDLDALIKSQGEIEKILVSQQDDTANWCALLSLKNYIEEKIHG